MLLARNYKVFATLRSSFVFSQVKKKIFFLSAHHKSMFLTFKIPVAGTPQKVSFNMEGAAQTVTLSGAVS